MKQCSKSKACQYCGDEIEIHHCTLHQAACYLNPTNLIKISEYILTGIQNPKNLRRANFYRWSKKNNILTSITIAARMGFSQWTHALYQLAIYGHLAGYIDFEYCECILYIITDGTMWFQDDKYKTLSRKALEQELKNRGFQPDSLDINFYNLLAGIIDRAVRDIMYSVGELDENDMLVDVEDSITFLQSFAPDVLEHRVELGLVSDDGLDFIHKRTPL